MVSPESWTARCVAESCPGTPCWTSGPNLAFVIPNQRHDTHSAASAVGDAWLADNVPALLEAVGPRGIVVLTWDEDDGDAANHILTVVNGEPVKPGYVSTRRITHYTLLRTLCEALGLRAFGAARSETPITDVWKQPGAASMGLGTVGN